MTGIFTMAALLGGLFYLCNQPSTGRKNKATGEWELWVGVFLAFLILGKFG